MRHSIPTLPLSGSGTSKVPAAPWVFRENALCAIGACDCAQYLPPVFRKICGSSMLIPPQTTISLPVHTAVCCIRASGTFAVLVGVQLSLAGLYLPPVFKSLPRGHA